MSSNKLIIKGERNFKKAYEKFMKARSEFIPEFEKYKENLEEERIKSNRHSDKWFEIQENQIFTQHLIDVEGFILSVDDVIKYSDNEYPETNE